jgi:hypothetical protein
MAANAAVIIDLPTLGRTTAPPVTKVIEPRDSEPGRRVPSARPAPEELAIHERPRVGEVLVEEHAGLSGRRRHEEVVELADRLEQCAHRGFICAVDDDLMHAVHVGALGDGPSTSRHHLGAESLCSADGRRPHPAGAADHNNTLPGQAHGDVTSTSSSGWAASHSSRVPVLCSVIAFSSSSSSSRR